MIIPSKFWILLFALLLLASSADSQIWPFRGGSSAARATRDLQERQRENSQGNMFNPLQTMGSRAGNQRDDHIWSSESALVNNQRSGNIAITSPSRFGILPKTELQSHLAAFRWVPNLGIKQQLHSGRWKWASRHGIFSPTPGLHWAREMGHAFIIDSITKVPLLLGLRNEIIVSKPFVSSLGCTEPSPYLILTGAISLDNVLSLTTNNLESINRHFFGARDPSITGNDFLVEARLRVDALLNSRSWIEGGVKLFSNDLATILAIEHHAAINYFLFYNTTISPGYMVSIGHFDNSRFKIIPWIDLTWYFGEKKRPAQGLFRREMF